MDKVNLFLKPGEAKFLAVSVVALLDDVIKISKSQRIPWNPEARHYQKDMIEAGRSLAIKMQKLGFDMRDLPEYKDGDENEFLTKES